MRPRVIINCAFLTQYERDDESGLDYAKARYYSSQHGRFTGVDPALESAVWRIPQSWNRYAYVLNNPLVFVDPNGELWVATGDAANPYRWVDQCGQGQTCYTAIAANVNNSIRVYGSSNTQDITNYQANENGMIDMRDVARHHDAQFVYAQQPHPEPYLNATTGSALFNVAARYHELYPNDSRLVFTAGSAADGNPARDERGNFIHESHRNGANIDMRYMGTDGRPRVGNNASAEADVERTNRIRNLFSEQNAGLGAVLTGNPERFGLGPISERLQRIHRNHMHFQRNYPPPPQPQQERQVRPGRRRP